ncbi:MAG: hypothetical protein OHK0052_05140 [Anaerolineales bacterium]
MRQIAREAGVALGGIYNHFASKEAIFEQVFFEYHPSREVLPLILQSTAPNAETFVREAATAMLKALQNRPDFLKLLFIEIVELNSAHNVAYWHQVLPDLQNIVQRFNQHSAALRNIPIPVILRSFIGLFFSYYLTGLFIAGDANAQAFNQNAVEHFIEIYLHGILAD